MSHSRLGLYSSVILPLLLGSGLVSGCSERSDDPLALRRSALSGSGWEPTGAMQEPRTRHTATTLSDGSVLVAGGDDVAIGFIYFGAKATAETYDPAAGTFTPTGPMTIERTSPRATRLVDGRVLITGGISTSCGLATAEVYDPSTRSFHPVGPMTTPRYEHTATLLPDGRVLIAGGFAGGGSCSGGSVDIVDIYDPTTESFSFVGHMTVARARHAAAVLPDGTVLLTGGHSVETTAEVFDPVANTFVAVGPMTVGRQRHSLFVVGGIAVAAGGLGGVQSDTTSEAYDSAGRVFSGVVLGIGASHNEARDVVLDSNRAVLVGGSADESVSMYDAVSGAWQTSDPLATMRIQAAAVRLVDGSVLVTGGTTTAPAVLGSAEVNRGLALFENGRQCTAGVACASGNCVDGVCCDTACGNGDLTDCQACSLAAGGTANGTCTLRRRATCRFGAGPCDAAEFCDGVSAACPADRFAPAGQICRPIAGICDVAETCDGAGASCPPDQFAAASQICRPSAGPCDVVESCTGAAALCPPDAVLPAGTTCPVGAATATCTGIAPVCGFIAGPDLVVNGDFSMGDFDWSVIEQAVPFGTNQYGVTNGQYCLVLNPSSSVTLGWPGDSLRGFPVAAGETYTLSYRASTTAVASFEAKVGHDAQPFVAVADYAHEPITATPTTFLHTFTVPAADAAAGVAFNIISGGLLATVCVDDVIVTKLSSADGLLVNGQPCTSAAACASSHCVDGVCCDAACGDGDPTDCQACSVAAGGTADGTCAASSPTYVCRAAAAGQSCDVAERCDGAGTDCPDDGYAPPGTTCGTSSGPCDVAATCTGGAPDCPANTVAPARTQCYFASSADPCKADRFCSGTDAVCASPDVPATDCLAASLGTNARFDFGPPGGADATAPGGVTLTFYQITSCAAPTCNVGLVESDDVGPPPNPGFQVLGFAGHQHYWEFKTNASYTGPPGQPGLAIHICIHYDPKWITSSNQEPNLYIEHWNATGIGMNISSPADTANDRVCGDVASLSPFALVAPLPTSIPKLTVPAPIGADATSAAGAKVSYTAPATDPKDGPLVPICTPASGSTFPIGTTTVTCKATDSLGIFATASFTVTVQFQAPRDGTFFLQPINPDGSSIFKCGSTIPVKFMLTGASAGVTNLVAKLSVAKLSSGVTGTYLEAASTAASDSGNTFRYDPVAKQYIFNLSTKGMAAGTWSLRADLGDGVNHTIKVSLK